jgi:hypothetical protein
MYLFDTNYKLPVVRILIFYYILIICQLFFYRIYIYIFSLDILIEWVLLSFFFTGKENVV